MSRLISSPLLAGLLVLAGLLPVLSAQDSAPEPAAPVPQEGPAPSDLVPALGNGNFGGPVEDIALYRVEAAPYVRRLADVVQMNVGDVDINADVVMTIGDHAVTRNEFRKRAIMYLAVNRVDQEITRMVTETQRAKLIAEGVDPAKLAIAEADLDEKIESIMTLVEMQARGPNPEADSEASAAVAAKARQDFLDSVEASVGMDSYRQMMAADVGFEKVFLPMPTEPQEGDVPDPADAAAPTDASKPDWVPQITWDALGMDQSGAQLRTFITQHGAKGEPIPSFFRGQITNTIRVGVVKLLGVKYFFEQEMPDNVFLMLGDTGLEVDRLWDFVKNDIADTDIELILREILTLHGIRTTLEAAGQWMDDETTAEAYAELNAQFEGTLFPLSSIIVIRGYGSIDRYREHWRHKESYFRWRKKSLSEDMVERHYRTSGRLFFERGSVQLALAEKNIKQGKGTFCDARFDEVVADMEAVYTAADMDAEAFTELSKIFPAPPSRQNPDSTNPSSALFYQRNPLRMRLTESELSIFLTGYSLADDIFYHGVPGEVFGPYPQRCRRHAWGAEVNAGAWMARVESFTRSRPLAIREGRELDQSIEDYLDLNFQYWAQECLKSLLPKVKFTQKG